MFEAPKTDSTGDRMCGMRPYLALIYTLAVVGVPACAAIFMDARYAVLFLATYAITDGVFRAVDMWREL